MIYLLSVNMVDGYGLRTVITGVTAMISFGLLSHKTDLRRHLKGLSDSFIAIRMAPMPWHAYT